jgi:hypothetical protein
MRERGHLNRSPQKTKTKANGLKRNFVCPQLCLGQKSVCVCVLCVSLVCSSKLSDHLCGRCYCGFEFSPTNLYLTAENG